MHLLLLCKNDKSSSGDEFVKIEVLTDVNVPMLIAW